MANEIGRGVKVLAPPSSRRRLVLDAVVVIGILPWLPTATLPLRAVVH